MPDDVKVDATDTKAADTTTTVDTTAKVDTKADPGKAADSKIDTKTIVDTAGTDDGADKVTIPADWPADWREKMAGDDAKFLSTLKRYSSPLTWAAAGYAAQQRIRAGDVREPLTEKATPEQVAAWREKNGIPAEPGKYELKLSDGLVIGDEHKPLVDAFLKVAHEGNMRPEDVNRTVDWYFRMQDDAAQQRYDADMEFKQKSDDALHQEWGQDYRGYVNAVATLLMERGGSEDFARNLLGARMPDGRRVGDDPDTLKMLVGLAIELNPAATVVPGGGVNSAAAIEDRLGQIQEMLGDFSSDYYKAGPVGDKLQAEYLKLLEAKARLQERHAA